MRGLIPEGHKGLGEVEHYLAEQEDKEKPGRIRVRGSGTRNAVPTTSCHMGWMPPLLVSKGFQRVTMSLFCTAQFVDWFASWNEQIL